MIASAVLYDRSPDREPSTIHTVMKPFSECARVIAAACIALLSACGGGGGGGGSERPDDGRADASDIRLAQIGCAFDYAPQAPANGTGNDPLLPQQWHLHNTGQAGGRAGEDVRALAAWSASGKGEGVRLAVVDDAIETLHEDLFPNLVTFRNYRPDAAPDTHPLPCHAGDDHGTAVAGVAAARDGNGRGVAGVAPRVELAAYNALSTNSEADVADALRRAGDITAIYNNSWGSPDERGTINRSGSNFRNAVLDGTRLGRGGLGAVYVFPAGNGGAAGRDNSNYDGYVNGRAVISACAVDINGRAPSWAESGANILVCGMSDSPGITTTDVRNTYQSGFSGTSASTPMVAGVAALVLQANPLLSWRDVRLILATTARKNDAADGDWRANAASPPLFVHPQYGFGVVDAEAATARAKSWQSVGTSESLKSCSFVHTPGLALRDQAPAVTDTIAVGADTCAITRIEFVEIGFSASHSYSGDLQIELQRNDPASPAARLADARVCLADPPIDNTVVSCGSYAAEDADGWVFGSVRNLDEPAQGEWTLSVRDLQDGDEGTWTRWSLTIWGR